MSMQWPWLVAKQYSNVTHLNKLHSSVQRAVDITQLTGKMKEAISCISVTTIHALQHMLKLLWHILNPPRSFVSWTGRCRVTLILIAFFFCPIMPLYLAHTAGCCVALWLMHPPRAPRSSEWTVAEPRGNLLGHSFFSVSPCCAEIFWRHWQRLWRIVSLYKL